MTLRIKPFKNIVKKGEIVGNPSHNFPLFPYFYSIRGNSTIGAMFNYSVTCIQRQPKRSHKSGLLQ